MCYNLLYKQVKKKFYLRKVPLLIVLFFFVPSMPCVIMYPLKLIVPESCIIPGIRCLITVLISWRRLFCNVPHGIFCPKCNFG